MNGSPFPQPLYEWYGVAVTETWFSSVLVTAALVLVFGVGMRSTRFRRSAEIVYQLLERQISSMVSVDPNPLITLVLSLWVFIGCGNLVGLVPGVSSPTGDLSLAAALAAVSFFAGHLLAFRKHGFRYLKQYLEPTWFLLPFNIIGEVSRTVALALRLFGNALSGNLIAAILVYLAGFLIPVPMMLLNVLTGVVQAYIFGVLALVFAASAMEVTQQESKT